MGIDIKRSVKPVKYIEAIEFLEKKVDEVGKEKSNDLIWVFPQIKMSFQKLG